MLETQQKTKTRAEIRNEIRRKVATVLNEYAIDNQDREVTL